MGINSRFIGCLLLITICLLIGTLLVITIAITPGICKNNPMPTKFSIQESSTLLQSIIASQDVQRDELGRELHNNVNQLLASARLLLEHAREDNGPDAGLLEKGLQCLNQAIAGIRKITQSLNTAAVDDIG